MWLKIGNSYFAMMFVVIGLLISVAGLFSLHSTYRLNTYGETSTATFTKVWFKRDDKGDKTWFAEYEFVTKSGDFITGKDSSFHSKPKSWVEGQSIDVRYDRRDPAGFNVISGLHKGYKIPLQMILVGFAFLGFVYWAMRDRTKKSAAEMSGFTLWSKLGWAFFARSFWLLLALAIIAFLVKLVFYPVDWDARFAKQGLSAQAVVVEAWQERYTKNFQARSYDKLRLRFTSKDGKSYSVTEKVSAKTYAKFSPLAGSDETVDIIYLSNRPYSIRLVAEPQTRTTLSPTTPLVLVLFSILAGIVIFNLHKIYGLFPVFTELRAYLSRRNALAEVLMPAPRSEAAKPPTRQYGLGAAAYTAPPKPLSKRSSFGQRKG